MRAAHDEATRQGSSVSASVVRTIDDLATMWKSAAARWAVYEAGGDSMEDVGSGGDLTMGDTGNAFADAYRKHAAGVGRVRVKATYRPTVASGAGAGAGAADTGAFGLSAAAAASRDVTFSVPSNVSWQRLRSECAQQFGKPVEVGVGLVVSVGRWCSYLLPGLACVRCKSSAMIGRSSPSTTSAI